MHITILYPPRKKLSTMSRRRKTRDQSLRTGMLRHVGRDIAHRPEFADLDPTSLHVWAYENYEPTIRNAARAIVI